MWLYICCKCGWRIEAEKVDQCPKCRANSWLCHSLDVPKSEAVNPVIATFSENAKNANPPCAKPEQLASIHTQGRQMPLFCQRQGKRGPKFHWSGQWHSTKV